MLKGEQRRLHRYAIESIPARVCEGVRIWFTILVLSANNKQQEMADWNFRLLFSYLAVCKHGELSEWLKEPASKTGLQ